MKRFDDEELVAHYLRELSPEAASDLERALLTDQTLAARYEAYATMLNGFKAGAATMVVDESVMARNWKALQATLPSPRVAPNKPSPWRYPLLAGAGLAFAATALFFVTRSHHDVRLHPMAPLQEESSTASPASQPESTPVSDAVVDAPSVAQTMEEQGHTQARGHAERPFASLSTEAPQITEAPQALPPRLTPSFRSGAADATVPHFIPLASASLPVLLPPFVPTVPRLDSPQAINPKARSRSGHSRATIHSEHPTDLTFAMGGVLLSTRETSGPGTISHTLGATHAISAVAAFHQQISPAVGYRVAVSYARPGFQYGYQDAGTSGSEGEINGRVYELAATYVVQGPHRGGLSTSAEAGGGLLAFLPTQQNADTSYNLRGAAVVGVATDVALSKHLGVHLAYRAQLYKMPDFSYTGAGIPVTSATVLSNEPMVGITYRFHSK